MSDVRYVPPPKIYGVDKALVERGTLQHMKQVLAKRPPSRRGPWVWLWRIVGGSARESES